MRSIVMATQTGEHAGQDEEFLSQLYKGGELLAAGKVVEAKDHLERAFKLHPKNEKAQNLLGLTYFKLGLFERASEIYELLVRDNPTDPTLRVNLGLVYLKTNNLIGAVREFEISTDLDAEHKKAHNYLGLALAQLGDYARAKHHFDIAGSDAMSEKMARALSAGAAAPVSVPVAPAPVPLVAAVVPPALQQRGAPERVETVALPSASSVTVETAANPPVIPPNRYSQPSPPLEVEVTSAEGDIIDAQVIPAEALLKAPKTIVLDAPPASHRPRPESAAGGALKSDWGAQLSGGAPQENEMRFAEDEGPPALGTADAPTAFTPAVQGEAAVATGVQVPAENVLSTSANVDTWEQMAVVEATAEEVVVEVEQPGEPPSLEEQIVTQTNGDVMPLVQDLQETSVMMDANDTGYAEEQSSEPPVPSINGVNPSWLTESSQQADTQILYPVSDEQAADQSAELATDADESAQYQIQEAQSFSEAPPAADEVYMADAQASDGYSVEPASDAYTAEAAPVEAYVTEESAVQTYSGEVATDEGFAVATTPTDVYGAQVTAPEEPSAADTSGVPEEFFSVGAEELTLSVNGELLSRLPSVLAVVGSVEAVPEFKRSRGIATESPFGEGENQMQRLKGSGVAHLALGPYAYQGIDLTSDGAYLREERVFAFQESISFENARLTGPDGFGVDIVHLGGAGRVLMRLEGSIKAMVITPGAPLKIPLSRLVGWQGYVSVRIIGLLGQGAVELTGDGVVWLVS